MRFCLWFWCLPLVAQLAPGSIDWSKVDVSMCGAFSAAGKTIAISDIQRSSDPKFVAIDPTLLPHRRMGDGPDLPDKPYPVVTDKCWPVDLWRNAFAVINMRCTRCHGDDVIPGPQKAGGQLDIRTRAGMIRGGKSGPVLKPGSLAGSLMYQRIVPMTNIQRSVDTLDVPVQEPPDAPLYGSEVEAIRAWIINGAPEF